MNQKTEISWLFYTQQTNISHIQTSDQHFKQQILLDLIKIVQWLGETIEITKIEEFIKT